LEVEPRPELPVRAVFRWLAVVADVGALAWLSLSNAPIILKVAVGGLELLGLYTIGVWYVAQRYDWAQREHERRLRSGPASSG
jgi:hypothetical protein